MPTITFTKTDFEARDELIHHCPPDSISSITPLQVHATEIEVVVSSAGEADAIEFMAGLGFEVTNSVP